MKIAGIGADVRHWLLFFFTLTLTRHPKGVDEKKKKSKQLLSFNKWTIVSFH